jgi:SAM-dependent methyltransferase
MLNSRLRTVCLQFREELLQKGPDLQVYASEWVSPFADNIRRFVKYQGSEYLPTPSDRGSHPDIRHEDITALSFASDTFDAHITNEVLEHVPNIESALHEAYRVLKPAGVFLAPFQWPMFPRTRSTRQRSWMTKLI